MIDYRTPEGFADSPFLYVFDAQSLTDGQTARNLTVQLDGDGQFLLRRVLGLSLCAGAIRLFDSKDIARTKSFVKVGNDWPIAPEIPFNSISSRIAFELQNVSRAKIVGPPDVFVSQLCFQGVKRRRAMNAAEQSYTETPYTYAHDLTLNWRHLTGAGQVEAARRFQVEVRDYDFELRRINICYGDGAAVTNAIAAFLLYDFTGRPLSNVAVNQQFINSRVAGYHALFPVPGAVYPVRTALAFDVVSNISDTDPTFPKTLHINFEGVRRIPK